MHPRSLHTETLLPPSIAEEQAVQPLSASRLIAGGLSLLLVLAFDLAGGFASNGFGAHSPGGYTLQAVLVCEIAMTFMFLMVILGSTDKRAPAGFAPRAIGLCLTLIHLISIPVSNTSVNPARSLGPAVYFGDWAVSQLWVFWVAPIAGAIVAGFIYRKVFK